MESTPKIYAAIARVMAAIGKTGIAKDRNNQGQGFKFRGIDDVYNALSPLLASNGVCILPRVLRRSVTEKTTKSGGALFYVVLDVEFDFVCSEDGSKHTVAVVGEAMDSGDKASNKAMSAAYKYACMQTFCIPTEGDNDADGTNHELVVTPYGEDHKQADPQAVDMWVSRIADTIAQDIEQADIAKSMLAIHEELNSDPGLLVAVANKLARDKVLSKDGYKQYIRMARVAPAMLANGRAA